MSIGGTTSKLYDSSTSSSFGDNKKSDVGHHLAPMKFTPFARKDVWHYSVTVTSMSVGSRMLPKGILQYLNDHRGTIVDSGTTDTFLSHHISKVRCFAADAIVLCRLSFLGSSVNLIFIVLLRLLPLSLHRPKRHSP